MRVLAVGDIHLGRTPSRLPSDLSARELGPAEAWRRAVDAALEAEVAAVLLAGDVVDRDEDFFEAYRELESGVRRLADEGIAVIGVAGNHDVEVLPRLARHIPEFRLLGAGGRWESCRIAAGGEAVTLWGWSFPRARFSASPLADQRFERLPGINLGLLHCDRDAGPDSPLRPGRRAGASTRRPRRLAARPHPPAGRPERGLAERLSREPERSGSGRARPPWPLDAQRCGGANRRGLASSARAAALGVARSRSRWHRRAPRRRGSGCSRL